jgi:CBS domain-containing membrane protein
MPPREWLYAALGGAIALALIAAVTLCFVPGTAAAIIVASMGASAVIVFGLPTSPLGQPWSLLMGHLVSALAGVAAQWLFAGHWFAPAIAVGLALGLMMALRCVHPPGGATALMAVIGGPTIHALGWSYVLVPVALNVALMLLAGLIVNNLLPARRYPFVAPANPHKTADTAPAQRGGINAAVLEQALAGQPHLLDLGEAELAELVQRALQLGRSLDVLRCADIMSRDVCSVTGDATPRQMVVALQQHRVHQLAVVDDDGVLLGLLDALDLLGAEPAATAAMLRRPPLFSAHADTPLASALADVLAHELHCLPVLAEDGRLQGVISQTDWLAVLANTPATAVPL